MTSNPLQSLQVVIEDFSRFQPEMKMLHEEFLKWFVDRRQKLEELQATQDRIRETLSTVVHAIRKFEGIVCPVAANKDVSDLLDCLESYEELFMSLNDTLVLCSGTVRKNTFHTRIA